MPIGRLSLFVEFDESQITRVAGSGLNCHCFSCLALRTTVDASILSKSKHAPHQTNTPIKSDLLGQGDTSGISGTDATSASEITRDSANLMSSPQLNFDSPQTELEVCAEDNVDRWLQEYVDPFEVKKRAVVETLSSEPELAAFAIPLFESQWKLQTLSLSPGVVSCPAEGTPAQAYTPASTGKSTGKRRAQPQRGRSSQPDRVPGDEDEEDEEDEEEPQRKRPKGNKNPEDEPARRKYVCPFHKRHPTKYCLSKDPNLETKEQKKWAVCGGQGFLHLRHLL
jgi:hypothetical protein